MKLNDTVAPSVLRSLFFIFTDSIAELLSHTPNSLPYYEKLSTAVSECSNDFEIFYPQLQKIARIYFARSLPNPATHERAQNAGSHFVSSWYILSYCLLEMRKNGTDPIVAVISATFDRVIGSLRDLKFEDMHDPIAGAVSSLIRLTQAVRRSVLFKINHSDGSRDDAGLKAEMKSINGLVHAFTQSALPHDIVRHSVLTELNELMLAVRLGFLFSPDLATIASTFEDFRSAFAAHADRAGIAMQQIPIELRPMDDGRREDADIDERMDLMEMLDAALDLIVKMWGQSARVAKVFGVLKQKAIDLEVVARDTMKLNLALNGKLAEIRQQNEQSQTVNDLKRLLQDVHVFATGERPDEIPDDEVHLIRGIKQTAEIMDVQRNELNDKIARAIGTFPNVTTANDILVVAEAVKGAFNHLEQESRTGKVRLAQVMTELGLAPSRDLDEAWAGIIAQIRKLRAAVSGVDAKMAEVTKDRDRMRKELAGLQNLAAQVQDSLVKSFPGDECLINLPPEQAVRQFLPKFGSFVLLSEVDSKLRSVLRVEEPPADEDYPARINSLLSVVQELMETSQKNDRTGQLTFVKARATIEMIVRKLRQYVGKEIETDFSKVDIADLVFDIADLCEQLHQQMMKENKFPVEGLFERVLPLLQTSSKDPSIYIPEFCKEFVSLRNSIHCLDGFVTILRETRETFDGRLESFRPGTDSFAIIREKVVAMQHLLNETTPGGVSTTVLSILSQFIWLLGGFIAALTAASAETVKTPIYK